MFVQGDLSNAFGNVHRTSVLQAYKEQLPAHPSTGWIEHFLFSPAVIALPLALQPDDPSAAAYMLTADGLPQGDPLSAMLFCNAVLWAYQRHLPPTITPTAYVDDVVIAGSPQEIEAAWDPLQKGLAEHGLHLNAAKSRMWVPPTVQYAFHHPQLYELASAKLEGLIICGSCLTGRLRKASRWDRTPTVHIGSKIRLALCRSYAYNCDCSHGRRRIPRLGYKQRFAC